MLLAGSFFDCPAWPDNSLPVTLDYAVKASSVKLTSFHRYRLEEYIDGEDLWVVEGAPEAIEAVAGKLRMVRVDSAPAEFWWKPPHYWPRWRPAGARLYATPNFPADSRGDGGHYLMLLDPERLRAFVWAKNNF